MEIGFGHGVGVDPDEGVARDAFDLEQGQDARDGGGIRGVTGDDEARLQVCAACGGHELAVDGAEGSGIDADLDEARADVRAVDAVFPLGDPARGDLVGRLLERVGRKAFVVHGAVVAGVGEDVDSDGLGQAAQNGDIAGEESRGAVDEGVDAEGAQRLEIGADGLDDLVRVVAMGSGLGGADEVDHDVLVGEGEPERVGGDGSADGHDLRLHGGLLSDGGRVSGGGGRRGDGRGVAEERTSVHGTSPHGGCPGRCV